MFLGAVLLLSDVVWDRQNYWGGSVLLPFTRAFAVRTIRNPRIRGLEL